MTPQPKPTGSEPGTAAGRALLAEMAAHHESNHRVWLALPLIEREAAQAAVERVRAEIMARDARYDFAWCRDIVLAILDRGAGEAP